MEINIVGEGDPFVHVRLLKGETLYCESNSMVTMDTTLELKAKMQGGFLAAIGRKFANGESFFNQFIEASFGDGETLLAPELPGELKILDIGKSQYFLNDGAFLAASLGVDLNIQMQGIGKSLFGGTGGFFLSKTSGKGQLVVSAFGTLKEVQLKGNTVLIDNYHVVAWEDTLDYEISMSTKQGGFMSNLVNSVTSGEGLVNKFSGHGTVYVCSRNRGSLASWFSSQIGSLPRVQNSNSLTNLQNNNGNNNIDLNDIQRFFNNR